MICARYAEPDRRRRAVRVGERRRWQWILLLTGSLEEVYELTPAQSRKDGLYGSGSTAVPHHNVESWGRAQDWQHEHIEQDEQTGHDESDFAVAVAISDSRSSGNTDRRLSQPRNSSATVNLG